jgi:low affinity Fe/Cu permease
MISRSVSGTMRYKLTLVLVFLSAALSIQRGRAQSAVSKRGGVCFEVADNQPLYKQLAYSRLFEKYSYKASFALNFAGIVADPEYATFVRVLQSNGHEVMDHTPDHAVQYFTSLDDARIFENQLGVDHVKGNLVCLGYEAIDTLSATFVSVGRLVGNIIISGRPGDFLNWGDTNESFVYVATLKLLFTVRFIQNSCSLDQDTLTLASFWNENLAPLLEGQYRFLRIPRTAVDMKREAVELLARQSRNLSVQLRLADVRAWVQPGGPYPLLTADEIKSVYGNEFGYQSALSIVNPSLNCYGEYDPRLTKRFGLIHGAFNLEQQSFAEARSIIADRAARHYVSIQGVHYWVRDQDWNGFLTRHDSLLSWCRANSDRILLKTYSEWARTLYDQEQNGYANIMPSIGVDLDGNNVPDGFLALAGYTDGSVDTTDGVPADRSRSFALTRAGSICYVQDLAGLEKGENDFSIWTKGSPGDFIEVVFLFPRLPGVTFKFPAESNTWTRYTLDQSINGNVRLSVPDTASTVSIRVRCSAYRAGTVKISGMEMRKKTAVPLTIASKPDTVSSFGSTYYYKPVVISQHYGDKLTFVLEQGPSWLQMDGNGIITGVAPAELGVFTVCYSVQDEHDNIVRQVFALRVLHRRLLEPGNQSVALGTLRYGTTKDTTVTLQNDGADSVSITNVYVLGSSTVTLSSRIIAPGRQTALHIRFITKAIGNIHESIVIESDADNSPDTISVTAQGVTATDTGTVDNALTEFALSQNFPNPFNPSTTISFSLRYTSAVRLDVVNVLGEKLRTLIGGSTMTSGTHYAVWNGSDDRGNVVSGGIYFVRLIATWEFGGRPDVATRKIVLLR